MFEAYDILVATYANYSSKPSFMSWIRGNKQLTKQIIIKRWEQDKARYYDYLDKISTSKTEINALKDGPNHALLNVKQIGILIKIKLIQLK